MEEKHLKEKEFYKLMPEILQIKDDELKEKVAKVWIKLWQHSTWSRIDEVPFLHDVPGVTLVQHSRATIAAAIKIAEVLREYHNINVDFDLLIAAAALHDVSKLVEYQKEMDKTSSSELGKQIPHGYYGGYEALNEGLPLKLVHLIITHTHSAPISPKYNEGIIVRDVDVALGDVLLGGKALEYSKTFQK
jgi:HD superfamily phosphodiesterase